MASRFIKSGILLTLVGLTMRSAAMIFGAFISRLVGAEGVGLYTLIMTVYSFAVTLATSGISLTVTRLVASAIGEGGEHRVGSVLRASFAYAFAFGLLATLGLFFGADMLGNMILSDPRTVSSLKLLSVSLLPISLSAVLSGYFIGVKRVAFNAVASVACQMIKILLTVFLVSYLSKYGTVTAVIGICGCVTITEILGFLVILFEFLYDRAKNGVKSRVKTNEAYSVCATALPLAFSAYVRSLLLNVEHILIPKKLRERGESEGEAYAHYGTLHGMALPLVTYPMSPLSSFAGLLVPEFAEDMSAGRKERISLVASRAMNATLTYSIISAVFLAMFSEELGYILYKSYDAGYYISTLALVVPIMYLDHVTDSILKGIGEQVFSMWINITDSLLSVFLVWILIPKLGIMGYAVVIMLMEAYNFALSFYRLKKRISFSVGYLSSGLVPLALSIFAGMITHTLFKFSGSTAQPLWLIIKMLFALCTVVFLLALGDFIKEKTKQKASVI